MNTIKSENYFKSETGKRKVICFIIFTLIGCITYLSLIIHELPNPDAIWNSTIYKDGWRWEASLGRYMIKFFQDLFGGVVNPAAFTMLSVFVLALLCVVVIDIFDMGVGMGLYSGLLILLTPAITGTLSYYYCSLYYCIAYLAAIVAAWFMCKRKGIVAIVFSGILLCLSLATYQAYIACTIVVAMLFLLSVIIQGNYNVKEIISKVLQIAGSLLLGVVLYLISNKVLQTIWDVTPEQNRGFSKMGALSLDMLPKMMKNCYRYTYQYFMTSDMINNFDGFFCFRRVHYIWILVTVAILLLCLYGMKKRNWNRVAAVLLIAILPIGIMFITLAAPEVSIYDATGMIMLPTANYIYLLPVVLVGAYKKEYPKVTELRWCIFAISLVLIFKMFNFSSAMQTYQRASMNKMQYVAESIADEIGKYGRFEKEYKVCIIGKMEDGNYPEVYPELANKVHWTTASHGTVWKDYNGAQACWKYYIKNYLGFEYNYCDKEKYEEIIQTGEFTDAGIYPESGSVFLYDDSVIVIKLSSL